MCFLMLLAALATGDVQHGEVRFQPSAVSDTLNQ